MKLSLRIAAACAVLAFLGRPVSGQDPEPLAPFFPLQDGNFWSYIGEGRLTEGARFHIRVDRHVGDAAVVVIDPIPLCFEPHVSEYQLLQEGDAVDIDMPGVGFVPHYRFAETSFTHNDFCVCDNGRVLTAARSTEEVVTRAGVFTCLRLDYEVPGECFDAGKGSEWWARGVGLVKWEEQTFAGPGFFILDTYSVNGVGRPAFVRGDSNQDDDLDLSDAVETLGFLFLGGAEPNCVDAADADDSGTLEITDPVYTLTFLFGGGEAPPPPAGDCGLDPTADGLSCQGYKPCD